jgi:hypothetical protein
MFDGYAGGFAAVWGMIGDVVEASKQAKEAMKAQAEQFFLGLQIEEEQRKMEAFMDAITAQADIVHDSFMDMFDSLFNDGFGSFFNNVIGGFQKMLADMARQYLASQVSNLLSRVIGGLVSGFAATQSSSQQLNGKTIIGSRPGVLLGKAVGGPVLSDRAVMVGERGPEMFVPSGNGRILTADQTRGTGGQVIVNMTVNTPDAGSFHASQGQTAQTLGNAIRLALKRNG